MTNRAKKTFDLANFDTVADADKGFEFELLNPYTKEPLGMFISVYGTDSQAFKEHVTEREDNRRRQAAMRFKAGQEEPVVTKAMQEQDNILLLVACTKGFRDVVLNGQTLEFSPDVAHKLYVERPWVQRQVDAAVSNFANFMKG